MSLKNQVVYIQFHPVAYMVKLNIEISMASLITKIAKSSINNNFHEFVMNPNTSSNHETHSNSRTMSNNNRIEMKNSVSVVSKRNREVKGMEGIAISETVEVSVEQAGDR
jgi:lipid A disaccharide synthetase